MLNSFPISSLSGLLVCFAALAYVSVITIYKLFFHPLSKYPGPFLAKFTAWLDVYHAYKEDKHLWLYQLHEKYGTFVRYGPNTLSINDPVALKAIYGHKSNVRKSDFYTSFPAIPGAVSTHTSIDLKVHARKRRVMSHAFSEAAIKGVEEFVIDHVSKYIRALTSPSVSIDRSAVHSSEKEWTEPKDVSKWSTYLGFDVMGDLSFGRGFSMLTGEKPQNRDAPILLMQAAKRHNTTGPMPWLHRSGFDRILFRKLNLDRDRYLAFSRSQVKERVDSKEVKTDRKDFFYYLLNSKDPETGEGFSIPEIWGESNTLIIAGSDTTSTTLTSTIFYLLRNRYVLQRLTAEIKSHFGGVDEIRSGPALNDCKYLRACIDEALRMSPPVGAILPRTVLAGGIDVLGEHIPEGTGVGCPIYAMHHHKDFVPDAFTYNPSRWLADESTEHERTDLQSVFNPFSIGSRGCIGKPMAYLELSLAIARLLWQYDMRLPTDHSLRAIGEGSSELGGMRTRSNEFQLYDIFVSDKQGPWAEFRRSEES